MADTDLAPAVSVTPNAAKRVQKLIDMEGKPGLMLRLGVLGGGCSGFQYQITLDDAVAEDDVVTGDTLRIVKEELYALPDDYKEILVLRDIEGLAYGDIARILGIHLSNVKVRIHRGRELLKKRLAERGLL